MDISNDDFLKPLLYRDIIGPENTPMGAAMGCRYGMGMYPTNLLGGISMPQGLQEDAFVNLQQREKKDFDFFKKTLMVIGVIIALSFMKFKGLKNSNPVKKITNLVNRIKTEGAAVKKRNRFLNLFAHKK